MDQQELILENKEIKKSFITKWWWLILLIIVLLSLGLFFLRGDEDTWIKDQSGNWVKHGNPSNEAPDSDGKADTTTAEKWIRSSVQLFPNTTSSDTHKISDNLFRMFVNGTGGIVYAESVNGETFGMTKPTGVTEDPDKMISNPSVLKLADGSWIMIYEQAPRMQPGQKQGPASATNQRNLYLATSTDGKAFAKQGLVIDSSKADNYFASVPDLVLLDDNTIRLYYVCRGDAICSQVSADNGKTWTKESGLRLGNMAVDPDVLRQDGKWLMYYSVLDPSKNGIYKATSTDGLVWTALTGQVVSKTANSAIVDPDVVEISDNKWMMYFGESSGPSSTGGETINLFNAAFSGNIF